MAFEDYRPNKGIFGSDFVGFQNFFEFFQSPFAPRVIRNTLVISFLQLAIEFPLVIVFALLMNEIRVGPFRKTVQMLTYMPYFISMVVMAGIIVDFCKSTGVVGQAIGFITGSPVNLFGDPVYWRPMYIVTNLWQGLGFSSIIYVAALAGIDQELYEAAEIDGATRWKQTIHITIPGIANTIIIMLILRIGSIMSVGQEKTILLYNSQLWETADIISSFTEGVNQMSIIREENGRLTVCYNNETMWIEPWGENALRMRPYTEKAMAQAHEKGTPVMRPLFYGYPQDSQTWEVEDQYLYGDHILVAPVMYAGQTSRQVYLPEGAVWTNVWTREEFLGGQTILVDAPLDRIPLFVSDATLAELLDPR